MAVYKSRRKDAAAQFIADARELRKYTVRVTRKFPKSCRDTTNGLTELAREIYLNSIKGNAIYLHKDISEHDYELRCNSYDTLRTMDEKFVRLFEAELSARKKKFKCTMKATKTEAGWIYRRHGSVREEEAAA